ncbi:related to GCV3 - glycine decarboxylase, subunit H [Cephalotrichum gorgonifer]|uniref:Glycine cleavage system H protein n=1 Tax=Cephalotrichum gorgonifer TaxID=2041049 RepID=A0AAE8N4T5_9PEZI|nr:related to GCV3 - glycine decarboxylase, subunit H [Cephalotrichum gorgonifer]
MASLFVKHTIASSSRALASRTVLSAKFAAPAIRSWAAPQRLCFSQTAYLAEKRYTETHEWVDLSADKKTCKIGITVHATEALGDVVYVEVPEVGDGMEAGEAFGSVESVKSASDIVSPVSGTITAVNEPIIGTPADIANDPEGDGWLVEVETTDVSGVESLMDAEAYAEFVATHE